MHHGLGYGAGPQERVHQQQQAQQAQQQQQVPRVGGGFGGTLEKCPYEAYATQIPDCCAAAAAAAAAAGQDPYPRPPSGYDTRCYDECHRRTPYQDDSYSQVIVFFFCNVLLVTRLFSIQA